MKPSATEQARDRFEDTFQMDSDKATVLKLLALNPKIRAMLPLDFAEKFNYRKADHWHMICDAQEFANNRREK